MSAAKIVRCHREHPEVDRTVRHDLPGLLHEPAAVFPSIRRDGSIVVALVVSDTNGQPIVVPIAPGVGHAPNVVLTVFGKDDGWSWIEKQIGYARQDGMNVYRRNGFATSVPQPGIELPKPSSPGLIPADGTTKPERKILTLRSGVKTPP